MSDLGYSVEWPAKFPPAIKQGVSYMKKIHSSWRANKLQAQFTPEQIKMIKLKVYLYIPFLCTIKLDYNIPFRNGKKSKITPVPTVFL